MLFNMKHMLISFIVASSLLLSGMVAGESSSVPMVVNFKGAIITKACIPIVVLGSGGPSEVVIDNYNPSGTVLINAFQKFGEPKEFIVDLKPSDECVVPDNIKFSGDTVTVIDTVNANRFVLENSSDGADNVGVLVKIKTPRDLEGFAYKHIDETKEYAVALYSMANSDLSNTISFRANYLKIDANPLKGGLVSTALTLGYIFN
jgi:type 1 fimbria pilin